MLGSALKKLAAENGMTLAQGVAYGTLRGYCTTLSEGAGYKQIAIATRFPEQGKQDELMGYVNRHNVRKEYRVQNIGFTDNGILIIFQDNPGTMKKLLAFIDWFWPLLPQYGATGPDICPECGMPVENGRWILRDGMVAFCLHEACAQKLERALEATLEERKQPGNGSYWLVLWERSLARRLALSSGGSCFTSAMSPPSSVCSSAGCPTRAMTCARAARARARSPFWCSPSSSAFCWARSCRISYTWPRASARENST